MEKRNGFVKRLGTYGLASALAFGSLFSREARADLPLKTVPESTYIVKDTNQHYVDLRFNSTQHPSIQFDDGGWVLYVPDQVDFATASLPDGTNNTPGPSTSLDDMFYNVLMDASYNRADITTGNGGPAGWTMRLTDNIRDTSSPFLGVSNVNDKSLERVWFTIKPATGYGGPFRFRLSGVNFSDTNGINYTINTSPKVVFDEQNFYIIPPPPSRTNTLSHKMHGSTEHSVNVHNNEVECRVNSGSEIGQGSTTLYLRSAFNNDIAVVGATPAVSVIGGNLVSNTISGSNIETIVNGVPLRGTITLNYNVADAAYPTQAGAYTGTLCVRIVVGDTGNNGTVSSADINQTKANTGPTSANNFRMDVVANGTISSADINAVKALTNGVPVICP